jgi:lysophospholipase L1-like esterase
MTSIFGIELPRPDQPEPRPDESWLAKHQERTRLVLEASQLAPLDIYFLGDSITEYWPELAPDLWRTEFGSLRVLNCGVSGDVTQNIIYRVSHGEFEQISPKVVVLLAGINNLGRSPFLEPGELADGLQRIVSILRSKSPSSKILLLSIVPAGTVDDPVRARIVETNKRLAALGDNSSVFYLDIYNAFLDSAGNFPATIAPDGLHLNAQGYQIWAEAMRPLLRKLLDSDRE